MPSPQALKLVVIFRRVPPDDIIAAAKALLDVGVTAFEITFDGMPTIAGLVELVAAVGTAGVVGAGTVLTAAQVDFAASTGAQFVVSPNTDRSVIEATKAAGLVAMPGALTPTEVTAAIAAGGDVIKVFPIAPVGGAAYVSQLRGPLPDVPLLATGGVTPEMAAALAREDCGVGVSIGLIDADACARGDWEQLARSATAYLRAMDVAGSAELQS